MTREGGAIGFVIRLLLGGALISGGLLYAAQALQKAPASREPVAEKIGPALSTRQAAQAARPAPPAVPEATVPAAPSGPAPAAERSPQDGAPALAGASVVPPAPAVQSQNPAPADTFGVIADDASPDTAADARAATRSAGKGQRGAQGCTQYKSYNPQTQTYRSFDGKIKDCRP